MSESTFQQSRGLKPASVLAAAREHGDRLRYMGGCRCDLCRKANSRYESERQKARKAGDWNGIVPAKKAQQHILKLSRQGVGRRAISAASDISASIILQIRNGERTQIRARTERRILSVTKAMASDSALVPAGPTWKLIENLLEEGYMVKHLCDRLGYKSRGLQFGREFVLVSTAARVERLHRHLTV